MSYKHLRLLPGAHSGGKAASRVRNKTKCVFVAVLGVDPTRWAKRYGIEPFSHACSSCGQLLTTSIPIAFESLRGLLAPTCSCGDENTPYCFVRDPKIGDLFTAEEVRNSKIRVEKRKARRARRNQLRLCKPYISPQTGK